MKGPEPRQGGSEGKSLSFLVFEVRSQAKDDEGFAACWIDSLDPETAIRYFDQALIAQEVAVVFVVGEE